MKQDISSLKSISYQRNGVHGHSCYLVSFRCQSTGTNLIAVVPARDEFVNSNHDILVFDPARLEEHSQFRNEDFCDELEMACRIWEDERGRCLLQENRDIKSGWVPTMKIIREFFVFGAWKSHDIQT